MKMKQLFLIGSLCLAASPVFAEVKEHVTPPLPTIAHTDPEALGIHGPRIVGATPGRPFFFYVPATGKAPLRYTATNLPAGLTLDADTGFITGALQEAGKTIVELAVTDATGTAKRDLTIVGGEHKLALTPPMGWNSWFACSVSVNADMVREAADWMVKTGLAAHGYQYICIDDSWGDRREEDGTVKLVPKKFKDMKAIGDYIHAKGLKFGIYSSPGPKTCTGYEGSMGHELLDAQTFAKWGVDYLKYDWCSYEFEVKDKDLDTLQAPYRIMRDALDQVDRDIVYSMCQYGMGDVWKWGADVGGNLWRTTGDIGVHGESSGWGNVAAIGFTRDGREKYAGPGHWNDPDFLMIAGGEDATDTMEMDLTPDEKIAHFSLWALHAAPLILSCDLDKLDPFTLDILTNDEVIDVNQDPLGKAASCRFHNDTYEVWARPLYDGTIAVGMFNRGEARATLRINWSDLGLKGAQPVRDLWQKKTLGTIEESYLASVAPHGVRLLKVGMPKAK